MSDGRNQAGSDDYNEKIKGKLRNVLEEFYDKQAGFHKTMNQFVLAVSPVSQLLTGEDKKWFQIYVDPYKNLVHSSFRDPGFHQDPTPRLEAIIAGGQRALKEYDLTLMSKLPKSGPAANKLYVELVNDELVYKAQAQLGPDPITDAVKVEGKITRAQFVDAIGAGRTEELFQALGKGMVSAINPFLDNILSITTNRNHTQEYEQNFLFVKLLQNELDAIKQAIFNYDNFRQFLNKIIKLPAVSKNPDALKALTDALGTQAIVPVQYGPRYQLLLLEIIKYIPPISPHLERAGKVCQEVQNQLKSVNEQIRKYENIGTCYLAEVDTIPVKDNRKEGVDGNLDELKLPFYSFVRVKNNEVDQLYYVNREKDQVILVSDAAKDGAFMKQFDSKIKLSTESPKSKSKANSSGSSDEEQKVAIRKLDNKELKIIAAMNLNFHEVREVDSAVKSAMEKVFDKSRTTVMSDSQLVQLIMSTQAYLDDQLKTGKLDSSMEKLTDFIAKLKALQREDISDSKRMAMVKDEMMQPFADIYVDERTKTWRGTHKGKTLAFFERILEDFNLAAAKSGQEDSVTLMKDTPDARIFRGFDSSPANSVLVAEQLFMRAMTEGVSGEQDIDIYVNARKAINRMGTNAINRWNELIVQKFDVHVDPSLFIAGSSEALEDEGHIRATYRKAVANPEVKETIDRIYYVRMLINVMKEGFPNKELIAKLEALEAKQSQENVDVSALVHRAVMDVYVTAGLMTRGSGLFGSSPKEINLGKLQEVLCEFQNRCGNELFGRLNFNEKITDKIMNEAILKSVASFKEESYDFAKRIFEHALHFGFMPSMAASPSEQNKTEAINKKIYTTDVRTIVQMGETAIKAWNELAVKSSPNPRVWANLLIQSTNRQEDSIGKLHVSLMQNQAFMTHVKQRRGSDTVVEPSQFDSLSVRTINESSSGQRL